MQYDGKKAISEFVHNRTYAEVKDDGRKETREETINRTRDMHQKKFPGLAGIIEDAFSYVHKGMAVPSMRSLQFGGQAIEKINERIYNCAFTNLTTWDDFHDAFFLLLCGTGVGYSVKHRHVNQLPMVKPVVEHAGQLTYAVADKKEGWADSVRMLLAYPDIVFDYSNIRKKGAKISSGGTASGPEALQTAHERIRAILQNARGRQLRPIEAHDIMCHIADGVIVGGVRRAAMICLFDSYDMEMQTAKSGEWYKDNSQRARANNSAVIYRDDRDSEGQIQATMLQMFASSSGEPGISLSSDPDMGYNPCHEIALLDGGLCNLTEINLNKCHSIADIKNAVWAATVIGTVQAAYTGFKVLQPKWKKNAQNEALLGVSATGQADNWELWTEYLTLADRIDIKALNKEIAKKIGINPAKRITTTKPSGSTSAWLGCSSGIHAAHSRYYIRHIRLEKDHRIIDGLVDYPFLEQDTWDADKMVVGFPVKEASDTLTKDTETAIELMERAKFVYTNWIEDGHVEGNNTHNVSLTVEYQDSEKDAIIKWMKENKASYAGISFLPSSDTSYDQLPFQTIDKARYDEMVSKIKKEINYETIDWTGEEDVRMGEQACAGGKCDIL